MYAPRPASTATSAIVERRPRMTLLTPPPPGIHTRSEDHPGDDEQRQPHDVVLLRGRQRDPPVVGLFGRMAMRFSCCDSHPTVFMNRSRLPWMPRPALAAKSESPNTTTRVSPFFSGSAPGFGGSDGPDAADTAAAIDTGPFLSPFDSSSDTCPDVISPLRSVSAQLRALVSAIVCAM